MTDITETSTSRFERLPLDVEAQLAMVGSGATSSTQLPKILGEELPLTLSREEVYNLGLNVAAFTEKIWPSRSGYTHGRRNEIAMVKRLGCFAAGTGDTVTANSAAEHLLHTGFSIRSYLSSLTVRHALNSMTQK